MARVPTHVKKPEGVKDRPAPDRVFGKKTTLTAEQRSDVCQTCHQKGPEADAVGPAASHQNDDLACNSCHKVHTNKDKVLAKIEQADVCFTCHKAQRTQINLIARHPIPEGKMTCSDCHNVHGSVGPALVKRDSVNETCYTCHAGKRGPFVHQHEPVAENCAYLPQPPWQCHSGHAGVASTDAVPAMSYAARSRWRWRCRWAARGLHEGARPDTAAHHQYHQWQERGADLAGSQLHELPYAGAWLQQPVGHQPDTAAADALNQGEQ